MKKMIVALLALIAMLAATVGFAAPASADGNGQVRIIGKPQTICHFTSDNASHQYNKIEVDASSIVPAPTGHSQHDDKADIIPPFKYYEGTKNEDKDWVWVEKTFPGQGDQTLLTFPNCQRPVVDTEIAVPAVDKTDTCEVEGDTVTPVRDDTKYTTVVGPRVNDSVTVTFTALNGFTFPNGQKTVTVTVNFPNNDDCDLPETGSTTTNVIGGLVVLALLGALGVFLLRRRNTV